MFSNFHLVLSFLEGLALVLSPCILPILPLMLGASLEGGKTRPFGIVAGFITAFTIFAILSRQLLAASGIDSEIIRNASLFLLFLFGIVMLFPKLSDKWSQGFTNVSGRSNSLINRIQGNGFWGGFGIGILIGVVWTPCAGPILGAAIIQIIQAESNAAAIATIAAFSIGAGVPMFLIALSGRALMDRLGFLKRHSYAIRRAVGCIMIAAAIIIYSGLDLKLVEWQARAQKTQISTTKQELDAAYPAPEISGITNWINSDELKLADLKGKVVLIDFWTYSCINCIRTFPHITEWYKKYKDKGLVIIGVHAPEFPFEKKLENVEKAAHNYGITYPIALDNNFTTWRAYKNRYWPAHYLINQKGEVVYTHFGEGKYDVTEGHIRTLLGFDTQEPLAKHPSMTSKDQSPETYLGYARAKNFMGESGLVKDSLNTYTFPNTLAQNAWAISGEWQAHPQFITAQKDAALRFHFNAGKVFLVLGTQGNTPIDVDVFLNGKPIGEQAGADIKNSTLHVDAERLYHLVSLDKPHSGIIELRSKNIGLQAYAFTFGQ